MPQVGNKMNQKKSLTILLEIIWWVATALTAFALVYPIRSALMAWPFQGWNVAFIVVLITFTRYIFLLQHTFLARKQVWKVALILFLIPVTFVLVSGVHGFMNYVEEQSWDPLTGHLPPDQKRAIEAYTWGTMIFFGVGSIVAAPILAGRLFLSIWRTRNRGTV